MSERQPAETLVEALLMRQLGQTLGNFGRIRDEMGGKKGDDETEVFPECESLQELKYIQQTHNDFNRVAASCSMVSSHARLESSSLHG